MDNFSNIVGHEFAKKFIISSLQKNRIAHAYIFVGPEAVGKFKFAIELAKIIQCGADYAANTDEKISLRALNIENGADPDVLVIDNLSDKTDNIEDGSGDDLPEKKIISTVSVADVRKVEHHLSLSPYYSKYKIAIIRSAHRFTDEAANAFLKTMEEPRGSSVIILIADSINFLPKTLISRSQMIRFGITRENALIKFLREKGASVHDAAKIARISGGKAGVASDLWKNPEKLQAYIDNGKEWQKFISGNLSEKFSVIEKIAAEEGRSVDILNLWLEYAHNCLIGRYLSEKSLSGVKSGDDSDANWAACPSAAALVKFIDRLNMVLKLMKESNVNKKLALENLALEI